MKKAIITVVGKDTVGILAKTCTYLADAKVNILDISQTVVQAAMEKGDEKAVKVYLEIGRFLAHAIPWYNEFYDYENMMILGRVTSGLGGSVILETAKAMLKDVYPEWAEKIDIFMPDEKARRLGQSVAAAQIPVIKKGK